MESSGIWAQRRMRSWRKGSELPDTDDLASWSESITSPYPDGAGVLRAQTEIVSWLRYGENYSARAYELCWRLIRSAMSTACLGVERERCPPACVKVSVPRTAPLDLSLIHISEPTRLL